MIVLGSLVPVPLSAQSSDRDRILAAPFHEPVVSAADSEPLRGLLEEDGCDSDWDGALVGTALGALPGLAMLDFSLDFEGEPDVGAVMILLSGTIAGFWAGLAIDSLDCEVEEPGSRVGPSESPSP